MMLSWKLKSNQIVEVLIKLIINGEIIQRIDVKHSVKTLGVCISPFLSCKDSFEYEKLKISRSFKKLIIADMTLYQLFLYFSHYMLINVFFGCGIVSFNKKQCEEFKKN